MLKALNNNTFDLNYFYNGALDSLESFIFANIPQGQYFPLEQDTVEFCEGENGVIRAYIPTFDFSGPRYTFLWNGGDTDTNATVVTQTGYYSITVSRFDGCASTTDSIYVLFNPIPLLPLMNDNLGLAVNEPEYWHYRFCSPDSV